MNKLIINYELRTKIQLNFGFMLWAGHKNLKLHGMGATWTRTDSERLIHKLTLEGYLAEIHITSKESITNTYVKTGPKAHLLLENKDKVENIILM